MARVGDFTAEIRQIARAALGFAGTNDLDGGDVTAALNAMYSTALTLASVSCINDTGVKRSVLSVKERDITRGIIILHPPAYMLVIRSLQVRTFGRGTFDASFVLDTEGINTDLAYSPKSDETEFTCVYQVVPSDVKMNRMIVHIAALHLASLTAAAAGRINYKGAIMADLKMAESRFRLATIKHSAPMRVRSQSYIRSRIY